MSVLFLSLRELFDIHNQPIRTHSDLAKGNWRVNFKVQTCRGMCFSYCEQDCSQVHVKLTSSTLWGKISWSAIVNRPRSSSRQWTCDIIIWTIMNFTEFLPSTLPSSSAVNISFTESNPKIEISILIIWKLESDRSFGKSSLPLIPGPCTPGGGGGTWVKFCEVCAADLSEPLPHYSLLWPNIDPILVTFGQMSLWFQERNSMRADCWILKQQQEPFFNLESSYF